jgi:hypothetical protein
MDNNALALLKKASKGVLFRGDRDMTLRSLDVAQMRAFFFRWDQPWPPSFDENLTAQAAMHYARLSLLNFDPAEKLFSALWLMGHKFDLPAGITVTAYADPEKKEPTRYELVGAEYD